MQSGYVIGIDTDGTKVAYGLFNREGERIDRVQHAADVNGPTSVFKSVIKLHTDKITGGVLLNQKGSPNMLEKPCDRQKLLLLRTFFNTRKEFHVQYNAVSRETLLDAKTHPENHKDLIVRVAGYSASFHALLRQTQDDMIARTEQVL